MDRKLRSVLFIILTLLFFDNNVKSQTTLIDFGTSAGGNTFGLEGWNTLLLSGNQSYTADGNGGVAVTSGADEFSDFRGVQGTPRNFELGERIAVTWYNFSDDVHYFTARISFTDSDEPNGGTSEGEWYTMRSYLDYRETFSEIQPYETAITVFNITDTGVHKTDESFSLININLAIEWGDTYPKENLICEKIELLDDADIEAPSAPSGLVATALSDSKVELNWNEPTDNVGVVEYLIYMNGEVEGYSRSNSFTCVFLELGTECNFTVSALDIVRNQSVQSTTVSVSTRSFEGDESLVNPDGINYLGAFVMPEEFNWGGESVAHNIDGDGGQTGSGASDGYTGSMFVTNLNQPENGLVGEVSIPAPVISVDKNLENLNEATVLQTPTDIRPASINAWDYVDIWRTGLEYLPEEGRLYSSWSIHYTVGGEKRSSISCCDASDLAGSTKYGAWYVGDQAAPPIDAMMNDWLFSVPQSWADVNSSGRNLVVGRCRDGGLSGLGPTMYAFSKVGTNPPAVDNQLEFSTLLEYGSVEGTDNYNFSNSIDGYRHSDDWRDALWVNSGEQNAIAVVGNKALGDNWYGYHGENMLHNWVIADIPYPEFYATDPDGKGWRAHEQQPMIIFYDPSDLASTVAGTIETYEPQPYAAFRIDKDLFFGANHEIFSAAFDNENSLLYVTEFFREADGRLIIHCWDVDQIITSIDKTKLIPDEFRLEQNYPNPFNPSTIIRYTISTPPHPSHYQGEGEREGLFVSLKIYDILGKEIAVLVDEQKPAGVYDVTFDAVNLPSGLYFYRLEAGSFVETRKMVLIK